jgi:hypothetical protein
MRAPIIGVFVAVLGCAAVAQNMDDRTRQPPPPANAAAAPVQPAAPVGHRQPTESSIPDQVRKSETTGSGSVDPLGPLPQICNRC